MPGEILKVPEFVHLHNHSDYSLLDGAQKVKSIIERVKELGMNAVAITEHGNMFSTVEFYITAKENGIKPIIGCEIYVTKDPEPGQMPSSKGPNYNHLVLLAKNLTGYKNLIKIVTYGYLEGFYYKPCVTKEILRKYSEGLIALSACVKGEIQELTIRGNYDAARKSAIEYMEIFPDRFYLEVQNHFLQDEKIWIDFSKQLSKELGIPRVATNDTHYTLKEHWEAHDALLCIGMGKEITDPNRRKYEPHEYYIKSPEEMLQLFPNDPEVIENTLRIADECNLEIEIGKVHLPEYKIPEGSNSLNEYDYLKQLVYKGLKERYPEITPEIKERADFELKTIRDMGFTGYFLIVQDFVKFAKDNGIPVGPGRGSAAGSLVAYSLGITNIDPLKYNLLFERFLNPERISMPDIDIDFCEERRSEVIDYIKKKYGEKSVTHIITFGTLKARAVIRDVGRVLGIPLAEVDRIAKMIPEGPGVKLAQAIEDVPELKKASEIDEAHRKLFEISLILEGMNRHTSTHAAGLVIAPGELTDYLPLHKSSTGDITTQYEMKCIDKIGLLKVDFLGLRNLTVIENTLQLLKKKGVHVDINNLPEKDEKTFQLFGEGRTIGVFQFESASMRKYLMKLKPTCIQDLIAMNALHRPGPMQMIEEFIKRKHGKSKIEYLHPSLEPILKETYGIIVYQEQVMQIAHKIAGFSLAKADLMRRAMGKKDKKTMKSLMDNFIQGAVDNGIEPKTAREIFNLIERFAEYGFNKSHSTAYAVLAYEIAYLKAHYPAEFMTSNISSEMDKTNRVTVLSNEARHMGLEILPPDVNYSEVNFSTDGKTIRYGLHAIKNVGEKAAKSIVEARKKVGKFKSFFHFVSCVDLRTVNRKTLESLVASGATDSLEGTRAQKYEAIDLAIQYAQKVQAEKNNMQASLFGFDEFGNSKILSEPQLPDTESWPDRKKWALEKELLGMYLSGHPLLNYREEIEHFSNYDFTDPLEDFKEPYIKLGGLISNLKIHYDRNKKPYAVFSLESINGAVDVMAFNRVYNDHINYIENDNPVFIHGKVSVQSEGNAKIIAERVLPLDKLIDEETKSVHLRLNKREIDRGLVENLYSYLTGYRGNCELYLHLNEPGDGEIVILSHNVKVSPDRNMLKHLKELYGSENVWVEG